MKKLWKKQISTLFLAVLLAVLACQWAWAAVSPLTEENVYNAMIAMKSEYPEKMSWTNDNFYGGRIVYKDLNEKAYGNTLGGGFGCAGFAWILSDEAFGDLPARADRDADSVRVGDILRIRNDGHSVIVLERDEDTVTVAEGNYNDSIHWGRKLSLSSLAEDPLFMRITRWPEREEDGQELVQPEEPQQTVQPDLTWSRTWLLDGETWYYFKDDGSQAVGWEWIGGDYYYFNAAGQMQTGWFQDAEGVWYFLNPKHDGTYGCMQTGWLQDGGDWYFLNPEHDGYGQMLQNGWKWIDGYSYYFDASGRMAADCETPDHYRVNASGQWVENGIPQYNPGAGIRTK